MEFLSYFYTTKQNKSQNYDKNEHGKHSEIIKKMEFSHYFCNQEIFY